jgi:hypothetical protein
MDRRSFLSISTATAMVSGLSMVSTANGRTISPGQPLPENSAESAKLSWDQFLEETVRAAKPLSDDRSQSGQDRYLYTIAANASRLGELPTVNPKDFGGLTPAYELDLIFRAADSPFIVLYWRMEPGAIFPAHCHPGANVCTLCTQGEVLLRNFETVPGSPECWSDSEDEFDVVESNTELLRAGAVNTVTEFRNNIHRFEAGPNGAEGIDITSGYDAKPKPFSFLSLSPIGVAETGAASHRGQWVGKDMQRAV